MSHRKQIHRYRGCFAALLLGVLTGCSDSDEVLTNAERADKAFNAKVSVRLPAAGESAPMRPANLDNEAQRDSSQTSKRPSTSRTSSSS